MKIWFITQEENFGNDTFDAVIVAAETEYEARGTHPYGGNVEGDGGSTWTSVENVSCRLVGTAKPGQPAGVILASYNAG